MSSFGGRAPADAKNLAAFGTPLPGGNAALHHTQQERRRLRMVNKSQSDSARLLDHHKSFLVYILSFLCVASLRYTFHNYSSSSPLYNVENFEIHCKKNLAQKSRVMISTRYFILERNNAEVRECFTIKIQK